MMLSRLLQRVNLSQLIRNVKECIMLCVMSISDEKNYFSFLEFLVVIGQFLTRHRVTIVVDP